LCGIRNTDVGISVGFSKYRDMLVFGFSVYPLMTTVAFCNKLLEADYHLFPNLRCAVTNLYTAALAMKESAMQTDHIEQNVLPVRNTLVF